MKLNVVKSIADSIELTFKNPELFVPDILKTILSLLIFPLMLGFSIFNFEMNMINVIRENTGSIAVKLVVSMLLFVIIGIWMTCMKYLMIKDVVYKKKKKLLLNYFLDSRKFFWRTAGVGIVLTSLVFLCLSIFIVGAMTRNTVLTIAGLVIWLAVGIFLVLRLFFSFVALFVKDKGVQDSLKLSWNFYIKNKFKVMKVILILVLAGIVFNLATVAVSYLNLFYLMTAFSLVFGFVLKVFSPVLMFKCYKG